jgi:type IV pilus assembly protein PilV
MDIQAVSDIRALSVRRRPQAGFSLIEVMVAVLVLSVGLLGMAALMTTSLRNTHSANQRTQAVNLAQEIVDSIRANLPNAMRYDMADFTDAATVCPAGSSRPANTYSSATSPHALDLLRWSRDLCYSLPNGQGRISINTVSVPVAATGDNYNVYQVDVEVCWFDDRAEAGSADCDNGTVGPDTVITVSSSL